MRNQNLPSKLLFSLEATVYSESFSCQKNHLKVISNIIVTEDTNDIIRNMDLIKMYGICSIYSTSLPTSRTLPIPGRTRQEVPYPIPGEGKAGEESHRVDQ